MESSLTLLIIWETDCLLEVPGGLRVRDVGNSRSRAGNRASKVGIHLLFLHARRVGEHGVRKHRATTLEGEVEIMGCFHVSLVA